MNEEKKPYLIINKECDEIQINIKHTKPYMKLQQENKQLKEKYKIRSEAYNKVLLENASLKDKVDLYKEVIEEVREYIKHEWFKREQIGIMDKSFQVWELEKLLQILDKVKENENENR